MVISLKLVNARSLPIYLRVIERSPYKNLMFTITKVSHSFRFLLSSYPSQKSYALDK